MALAKPNQDSAVLIKDKPLNIVESLIILLQVVLVLIIIVSVHDLREAFVVFTFKDDYFILVGRTEEADCQEAGVVLWHEV